MTRLSTERESTQLDSTTSVQASLILLHESYFQVSIAIKRASDQFTAANLGVFARAIAYV